MSTEPSKSGFVIFSISLAGLLFAVTWSHTDSASAMLEPDKEKAQTSAPVDEEDAQANPSLDAVETQEEEDAAPSRKRPGRA